VNRLALFCAAVAVSACGESERPPESASARDSAVSGSVVYYVEASDSALEAQRREASSDDFHVIADDLMFYRATALEFLETRGYPVQRVQGRRPLRFVVGGAPRAYDFADVALLDFIVVYEPEREPMVIAPNEVERVIGYFRSGAGQARCDTFALHGLRVPVATRKELAAALGASDSIHARAQPNRHDPSVTDSLVTVHYAGLTAVHLLPGGERDLVDHVIVTDNRHLRSDVGIGAEAEAVVARFGQPVRRSGAELVFQCGEEIAADAPIVFQLANGRVQRIVFNYYVD
jgi:hypothetical protein